jgi:DnaJ-class molecular chaperone
MNVKNADHYSSTDTHILKNSKYGDHLQTNGKDFICPECGGYGVVGNVKCLYCKSTGFIQKNDERLIRVN